MDADAGGGAPAGGEGFGKGTDPAGKISPPVPAAAREMPLRGVGGRGIEGKIAAIQFARERKLPYFGICFGMQLAVLETARNVAGIKNASSTEFGPTTEPVIALLREWVKEDGNIELRGTDEDLGGTMRLGAYQALIKDRTLLAGIYNRNDISERHRHRYEVNPKYETVLKKAGLFFFCPK